MSLFPPEGGPEESFGAEEGGEGLGGSPEQARETSEKFQAQIKSDQAALQALYKEEKKSKQKDAAVATSIAQFLQDEQFTHIALLVAKLVAKDTPSHFLLALLALIDEQTKAALYEKFAEVGIEVADNGTFEIQLSEEKALTQSMNPEVKAEVDAWVYHLFQAGSIQPSRILQSLVSEGGDIDLALTQLTTFVLQHFLKTKGVESQFQEANTFVILFITKILTELKKMEMKNQLSEGNG